MKDLWVSNIPRESSEKVDKYLSTYITYDTTTFTPQLNEDQWPWTRNWTDLAGKHTWGVCIVSKF